MKKIIFLLIISANFYFAQNEKVFDHSVFTELLSKNVDSEGMINYAGFDNPQFGEYLNRLGSADTEGFEEEEKLAFYINTYNAFVIKNVLNHYPIEGPMKVEGFFDNFKFNITGEEMSLNQLEYDIILKIEPVLTHFGLVCAAVSCPKLLKFAYTGDNVYELLRENGKVFLSDPKRNYLDKEKNILYLSEIFRWFRESFEKEYGSLENAVKKLGAATTADYLDKNDVTIEFITYDWSLNSQ